LGIYKLQLIEQLNGGVTLFLSRSQETWLLLVREQIATTREARLQNSGSFQPKSEGARHPEQKLVMQVFLVTHG
jgi:hypothetical protein